MSVLEGFAVCGVSAG